MWDFISHFIFIIIDCKMSKHVTIRELEKELHSLDGKEKAFYKLLQALYKLELIPLQIVSVSYLCLLKQLQLIRRKNVIISMIRRRKHK